MEKKPKQIAATIASASVKVVVLVIIVFVVVRAAAVAYSFGYGIFVDQPMATGEQSRTVDVTILEGSSVYDMSRQLEAVGLVSDANIFFVKVKLAGAGGDLKPGKYTLNTSMRPSDIIASLEMGPEKSSELQEEN